MRALLALCLILWAVPAVSQPDEDRLSVQEFLWMLGSPERLQFARSLGYIQGVADTQIRDHVVCLPRKIDDNTMASVVYDRLDALKLHDKVTLPAGPSIAAALSDSYSCHTRQEFKTPRTRLPK